MEHISIKCDRCGKQIEGIEEGSHLVGFYRLTGYWAQFAKKADEKTICNACMWVDPVYQKAHRHGE